MGHYYTSWTYSMLYHMVTKMRTHNAHQMRRVFNKLSLMRICIFLASFDAHNSRLFDAHFVRK